MGSRYRCICNEIVRNDLFAGNDIQLLADEDDFLRKDNLTATALEDHADKIIDGAKIVSICRNCERLTIQKNDGSILFYEPVTPPPGLCC